LKCLFFKDAASRFSIFDNVIEILFVLVFKQSSCQICFNWNPQHCTKIYSLRSSLLNRFRFVWGSFVIVVLLLLFGLVWFLIYGNSTDQMTPWILSKSWYWCKT